MKASRMASEAKKPGRYDRARALADCVSEFGYISDIGDLEEVRSAWKDVEGALAATRRRKTGNAEVDDWTAKAADFAKRFRAALRKKGDGLPVFRKYGDNFSELAEAGCFLFAGLRDDEPTDEAAPDPPKFTLLDEHPDSIDGHVSFLEHVASELRSAAKWKATGDFPHDTITKALHLKQWEEAKRRMASPGLPEPAAEGVRSVLRYPLAHYNVGTVAKLLTPAVERLRIDFQAPTKSPAPIAPLSTEAGGSSLPAIPQGNAVKRLTLAISDDVRDDLRNLRKRFIALHNECDFPAYRFQYASLPILPEAIREIVQSLPKSGVSSRLETGATDRTKPEIHTLYWSCIPEHDEALRAATVSALKDLHRQLGFGRLCSKNRQEFPPIMQFLIGALSPFPPDRIRCRASRFVPWSVEYEDGGTPRFGTRWEIPFVPDYSTRPRESFGPLQYANAETDPEPLFFATEISDVCFAVSEALDALLDGRLGNRITPHTDCFFSHEPNDADIEAVRRYRERWGAELDEAHFTLASVIRMFYERADGQAVAASIPRQETVSDGVPAALSMFPQMAFLQQALTTITSAMRSTGADPPASGNVPEKPDRATESGEAATNRREKVDAKAMATGGNSRAVIHAALIEHHRYQDGRCDVFEPIGVNDLAKKAGKSPASATRFFKHHFGNAGHDAYVKACLAGESLVLALRNMDPDAPLREKLIGAEPTPARSRRRTKEIREDD